jgi:cytochrome c oxidase cbb3-type subunit III
MEKDKAQDTGNRDIKLKEHSYDGIEEFDQKLPNWWLLTLYGAIVFSVVYWVVFHQWLTGKHDIAHLQSELAKVEQARLDETLAMLNDDTLLGFSTDPLWVSAGESIFKINCVTCHGPNLEGGIGVNLVDAEWLHGGRPTEIFHTVVNGVQSKGMQSWASVLSPKQIAEVTSFVLSKQKKS